MSCETAILQLEALADRKPAQRVLATVTARWLRCEAAAGRGTVALKDMLIQDVLRDAQMVVACGWLPVVATGRLTIYCDGSCTNNGRAGAKAGFGVYVTRDGVDVLRHSEPLTAGEPATNQRAELRGLQYALDYVKRAGTATADIYTDSKYSLNCLQTWGSGWEKNGWKKSDGKDVLHQDVLKPMMATWKFLGGRVVLHHVLGHTGSGDEASRGNAIADELACAATG